MHLAQIEGKVFRRADGEMYGVIRGLEGATPTEIMEQSCTAFAEDECGNYFIKGEGFIGFWDHETNEVTKLARFAQEFVDGLILPSEVALPQAKVVSAWIDSDFLKNLEIK